MQWKKFIRNQCFTCLKIYFKKQNRQTLNYQKVCNLHGWYFCWGNAISWYQGNNLYVQQWGRKEDVFYLLPLGQWSPRIKIKKLENIFISHLQALNVHLQLRYELPCIRVLCELMSLKIVTQVFQVLPVPVNHRYCFYCVFFLQNFIG